MLRILKTKYRSTGDTKPNEDQQIIRLGSSLIYPHLPDRSPQDFHRYSYREIYQALNTICRRIDGVEASSTTQLTSLNNDTLPKATQNKKRKITNDYTKWVNAMDGKETALQGAALKEAKNSGTVISKNTFSKRQLVDVLTGQLTTLTGDTLASAQRNKTVITRGAYNMQKWVEASTGKLTSKTDEALNEAIKNGTVVNRSAYNNNKWVEASTGRLTPLTGEALNTAIKNNEVIHYLRWYKAQPVNTEIKQILKGTGDDAQDDIITRSVYYNWNHRNKSHQHSGNQHGLSQQSIFQRHENADDILNHIRQPVCFPSIPQNYSGPFGINNCRKM